MNAHKREVLSLKIKAAWESGAYAHVEWSKTNVNRVAAVKLANAAKAAALTEKHRAEILEFAASRGCIGTKDSHTPWKVLSARLGIDHGTLLRIRRELGLPVQRSIRRSSPGSTPAL